MKGDMKREGLKEKLKALSKNGKISCSQVLRTAQEEDISPRMLGELLNEMKIKIAACQLGCFP